MHIFTVSSIIAFTENKWKYLVIWVLGLGFRLYGTAQVIGPVLDQSIGPPPIWEWMAEGAIHIGKSVAMAEYYASD